MGKTLILTEKPSVAREYAAILGVKGNGDGIIENEAYVITWCIGHLVQMAYPEKYDSRLGTWNLEDLPFLPEKYLYEIVPSVKKQYKIVHEQMQRKDIDVMLYCGDSGREGEVIGRLIRNYGGVRAGMVEKRVWIDSQTREEILRGIKEAKPLSAYDRLAAAGIMRGIEDYAMGINFSRALTCKYGRAFNQILGTDKWKSINVGRVMTCVLGMIVERERQIREFAETPFYRVLGSFDGIEAEWKAEEGSELSRSGKLYKENGFRKRADAEGFIAGLSSRTACVQLAECKDSRKKAPLLFNLAELQAECSRQFKLSPNETLETAQELYEKKMTTYPRTDARVLSSAIAKEIRKNISGLGSIPEMKQYVSTILSGEQYAGIADTPYTDDKKITDHYAIIPTGQNVAEQLTEIQKKVYGLIVRRFLSIFYPPAVYLNCQAVIAVGGELFHASCSRLKSEGYLVVAGKTGENEKEGGAALLKVISDWKKGSEIKELSFKTAEGKTTAPKRYDSGSMVLAMENAGKLIEDPALREQIKGSGIGTSATRAEIIDKLVRTGYIMLNKKTQVLTPERDGELVYDIIKQTIPDFLSPEMTASWEKKLSMIAQGELDEAEYRREIEEYVRRKIEEIKRGTLLFGGAEASGGEEQASAEAVGECPLCHKPVRENQRAFSCIDRSCGFTLWKDDYFFSNKKKSLTKSMARSLLSKGEVFCKGLYSETKKKTYDATILMKLEQGRAKFELRF